MVTFHLILLAIVQGLTEFLPVSSSGHLILLPMAIGTVDQGIVLDVAVHVGTLVAVMMFFRAEVGQLIVGTGHVLTARFGSPEARLTFLLALSTVPVVMAGLVLHATGAMEMMRSVALIGWTMIGFGLLLWWADRTGSTERRMADWSLRDALAMGAWQAVSLIPGTSRSGITITASRMLGYDRADGARIAMLMSIPTIIASGALLGVDVVQAADWQLLRQGAVAAAVAFVAAYLALAFMMRLLRSVSFTPYVIYRVVLGSVLLWIAYA
jgi:undecaprenyl-diphosphatase